MPMEIEKTISAITPNTSDNALNGILSLFEEHAMLFVEVRDEYLKDLNDMSVLDSRYSKMNESEKKLKKMLKEDAPLSAICDQLIKVNLSTQIEGDFINNFARSCEITMSAIISAARSSEGRTLACMTAARRITIGPHRDEFCRKLRVCNTGDLYGDIKATLEQYIWQDEEQKSEDIYKLIARCADFPLQVYGFNLASVPDLKSMDHETWEDYKYAVENEFLSMAFRIKEMNTSPALKEIIAIQQEDVFKLRLYINTIRYILRPIPPEPAPWILPEYSIKMVLMTESKLQNNIAKVDKLLRHAKKHLAYIKSTVAAIVTTIIKTADYEQLSMPAGYLSMSAFPMLKADGMEPIFLQSVKNIPEENITQLTKYLTKEIVNEVYASMVLFGNEIVLWESMEQKIKTYDLGQRKTMEDADVLYLLVQIITRMYLIRIFSDPWGTWTCFMPDKQEPEYIEYTQQTQQAEKKAPETKNNSEPPAEDIEHLKDIIRGLEKKNEELTLENRRLHKKNSYLTDQLERSGDNPIITAKVEVQEKKIRELQEDIGFMSKEIETLRAQKSSGSQEAYDEVYPGETGEILKDILKKWRKEHEEPSRRQEVVDHYLAVNPSDGTLEARKEYIRQLMSRYTRYDDAFVRGMKAMGIECSMDGKHASLSYPDGKKGYVTVALTPSDPRTSLNMARDIIRQFL